MVSGVKRVGRIRRGQVTISGSRVFIGGQGFTVRPQDQASFIKQQTGGATISSQRAIAVAEQKATQLKQQQAKIEAQARVEAQTKALQLKQQKKQILLKKVRSAKERIKIIKRKFFQEIKKPPIKTILTKSFQKLPMKQRKRVVKAFDIISGGSVTESRLNKREAKLNEDIEKFNKDFGGKQLSEKEFNKAKTESESLELRRKNIDKEKEILATSTKRKIGKITGAVEQRVFLSEESIKKKELDIKRFEGKIKKLESEKPKFYKLRARGLKSQIFGAKKQIEDTKSGRGTKVLVGEVPIVPAAGVPRGITDVVFLGKQKFVKGKVVTDIVFKTSRGNIGIARGVSVQKGSQGQSIVFGRFAKRGVRFPSRKIKLGKPRTFVSVERIVSKPGVLEVKETLKLTKFKKVFSGKKKLLTPLRSSIRKVLKDISLKRKLKLPLRITRKNIKKALPSQSLNTIKWRGTPLKNIIVKDKKTALALRRLILEGKAKKFPISFKDKRRVIKLMGKKEGKLIAKFGNPNSLEPQVAEAVRRLNVKGYRTTTSGFFPESSRQHIVFKGVLNKNIKNLAKSSGLKVKQIFANNIELSIDLKGKSLSKVLKAFNSFSRKIPGILKKKKIIKIAKPTKTITRIVKARKVGKTIEIRKNLEGLIQRGIGRTATVRGKKFFRPTLKFPSPKIRVKRVKGIVVDDFASLSAVFTKGQLSRIIGKSITAKGAKSRFIGIIKGTSKIDKGTTFTISQKQQFTKALNKVISSASSAVSQAEKTKVGGVSKIASLAVASKIISKPRIISKPIPPKKLEVITKRPISKSKIISVKSKVRVSGKTGSSQVIKQLSNLNTTQKSLQKEKQKSKQLQRQLQKQTQKVRLTQKSKQLQRQLQAQRQKIRLTQRQVQVQISRINPSLPRFGVPKLPRIILIPVIRISKVKRKKIKPTKPQRVFNVFGKVKGKFIRLNRKPLTKNDALDKGAFAVDRTTARTFKIVPAGKSKKFGKLFKGERNYFKRQGFKLREFRIKKGRKFKLKNKYIEKRKFGIDTRGEKKGLTIRRLLTQQRTSRKRRVVKRKPVKRRVIKRRSTVTPTKARKILKDKKIRGKPLTKKQTKFFRARATKTKKFIKRKSKSRQPRRKIIRTKIRIKTKPKRILSSKQLDALAAGRKKLKQMREGR